MVYRHRSLLPSHWGQGAQEWSIRLEKEGDAAARTERLERLAALSTSDDGLDWAQRLIE